MIKLIYEPNEDMKDYCVDKIEIESSEEGHVGRYIIAFRAFLSAVGFAQETIDKYIEEPDI